MLIKNLKKNMNIIFINMTLLTFINFFLITDFYLHIYLKNKDLILKLLKFLKSSSIFNVTMLIDIKCDDIIYFSNKYRYKITYIFLSLFKNIRYFLTIFVKKNEKILSIKSLFSSASFLEREI
jgi:NADH-quinone oxidoreductase subunit C